MTISDERLERRGATDMENKKTGVPASIRKGFQASDPLAAITNLIAAEQQGARSDKPRSLIESIRYVGGNKLEARDHALYEQLYSWARLHGIEQEEHEITADDMVGYLEIERLDRIRDSISRIIDTRVSYDFVDSDGNRRRGEKVPLLIAETSVHLKSGASKFVFSIPPMIRRYVAASTNWTWLELAAFPHFKSKYSSTFYQRCALIAGYDCRYRHPWTVTPTELSEILGYQPKQFNFRIFMRDVLAPVLKDIEQHVKRFTVKMDKPTRATGGRGRAVVGLTFHVEPVEDGKNANEYAAARLSDDEYAALGNVGPDLMPEEKPGSLVVGQAVTMTGHKALTLLRAWASAVGSAKANPGDLLPCGLQGGLVLYVLQREGVGEAFLMWAKAFGNQGKYPQAEAENATAQSGAEQATVKKTPPPIKVPAPKAPITVPAAQIEKGLLDGVKEIVVPIDTIADREKVAAKIRSTIQLGDDPVTVSIRYYEGEGFHTEKVGELWLEEEGFQMLKERTERDLMSDLEMVR
jgi:hypothetical protein